MFGGWQTSEADLVAAGRRYRDEIGLMAWMAPQDWMCEPWLTTKTGLSVIEHQRRTIRSVQSLRAVAPDLPVIPVLQGWTLPDYLCHVEMYEDAGFSLPSEPVVGLGSVCRRQATDEIAQIVATLNGLGLKLHGFGIKTTGLQRYGWLLDSADSLAWSFRGRNIYPCPHTGTTNCAHCLPHALAWRENALRGLDRPVQQPMVFR